MINLNQLVDFCMKKPGVSQEFPFDKKTMVFKLYGKVFLLTNIQGWQEYRESINIKNSPEKNISLRNKYSSIIPGYHMNKKHWNTIQTFEEELNDEFIFNLISESYKLVKSKLAKTPKRHFLRTCLLSLSKLL